MNDDEWRSYALDWPLSGERGRARLEGEPITDDTFVLFFNAHHATVPPSEDTE
jgi:hypothetical protein